MDCNVIAGNDLAERYLRGELSAAEQEAYEQHFFECQRCFKELDSLRVIQDALRAVRPAAPATNKPTVWNPWWRWPMAGAAVAALAAVVFLLQQWAPALVPIVTNQPPVPAAGHLASATVPGGTADQPPDSTAGAEVIEAPVTVPKGSSKSPGASSRRADVLMRLARVEPPRYSASILRGPTDEATLRFHEGMSAYNQSNYAAAVQKLRDAAALDPSRPDIAFFLGASELLLGDTTGAEKELRRTIALGDTPFLEEAHFYLAKAYLGRAEIRAARTELAAAAQSPDRGRQEAFELLAEMDRLDLK